MTTVDALVARLGAGDSPAVALASLMPPADAELLKRCSAVRSFDAETVKVLAADLPAGATIEPLVDLGFTEPVPSAEGVYRVRESIRSEQLERWWDGAAADESVPPALAELSRRLVDHFDERGKPVEALYHELAADRAAGIDRFEALYAEADETFDLPRCRDLVDVLGERLDILDSTAAELRNRYRRYLDARGFWIDDWYRSARFLQPQATRAAIEELLNGERRVLQLWARGGMGKTMLVRWMIARRCVPEPQRIACARIDFDGVDAVAAVHDPALVLLEFAAQLNQQLGAPFQDLLRQHGHHRERLRLRPAGATESPPAGVLETVAAFDEIRARFVAVLGELPPSERVLLVLDTLEVALLGGAGGSSDALAPLLEAVAEVHDRAPSVRLILAGRYELSERVPRFGQLFPAARSLELAGFDDNEAAQYLTEKRGVEPGDVLRAAIRVAGRMPFKLALIADVVEERPDLTATEIDEYDGVDLAYLIERVVLRVDDEVQWVLRYGVVPRVLDLPFVREVMKPLLQDATSGRSERDAPHEDALPLRAAARPLFRTDIRGADDEIDVEALWSSLCRYAGTSSWVSVEREDASLLRFHPDVVEPMRRLVSRHPVFDDLQRAACDYFERKAETDEKRWARWTSEAAFHRFQAEGPDAARYWHDRLEHARQAGDVAARRALASDLFGNDYLDDGVPRPWRRGRPLVARATLAEAAFELAWANVQLARADALPPTDSAWTAAGQQLASAEALQEGRSRPAISRSRLALVRTPLLLVEGRADDARAELEIALRGRLRRDERLWLLVEYADARATDDRDEAHARLERALEFASRAADAGWRRLVLLRLALLDAAVDDLAAALRGCRDAAAASPDAELERLHGDLALRAGRVDEAAAAAAAARALGAAGAQADLLEARAHLAAWDPARAVEVAEHALSLAEGSTEPNALTARAALVELRGEARARLLDVEGALGDFVEAADLWSETGSTEGIWRALRKRAEFLLRELGDVNEAAVALDQAERVTFAAGADIGRANRLLRAEIAARAGAADALGLVEEVAAELDATDRPHDLVLAELAAIAVDPARPLGRVAAALARVTPATARLAFLEPLERCQPVAAGASERGLLRRLVPHAEPGSPLPLRFADVELDRVLGRTTAAARKLEGLRAAASRNLYARRKWLDAAERLDEHVRVPKKWAVPPEADARGSSPLLTSAGVVLGVLVGSGVFEVLLDGARRLLDVDGVPAGGWRARLHEAAARVARNAGEAAEERRQLELAAEVYAQLGDMPARDRVLGGADAPQHLHPLEEETDMLLSLSLQGRQLRVDVQAPGSLPTRVARELGRLAAAIGTTPPPFAKLAAEIAHDWPRFGHDLGELLAPALVVRPPEPLDLRLRITDVVLQSLPWEIARTPDGRPLTRDPGVRRLYRTTRSDEPAHEDVRVVQFALRSLGTSLPVDGILGPATTAALKDFQAAAGLPATGQADQATRNALRAHAGEERTVALVRASRAAEERSYRGSQQVGLQLEFLYRRAGFRVDLRPPNAPEKLFDLAPTIVHLAAGLLQSPSGGIEFDFSADIEGRYAKAARGRPRDRLGATALDIAFRRMALKPIVVLDPPAPSSPSEAANQLLLRNALAGDLLALGNVEAVVATGLALYSTQEPLYDALVGGLAHGATLGEITTTIRRLADHDRAGFEEELAFRAVALFARRGDVAAPAGAKR